MELSISGTTVLSSVSTFSNIDYMAPQSKTLYAFAPASVGNFGPFYDVAGFCLKHLGDIVEARPNGSINDVRLVKITGPYADELDATGISLEENNVQKVANWIWGRYSTHSSQGIDLILHKYLPLKSGLGSSSASCVAAAKCMLLALDLDNSLSEKARVDAAMQGELRNNEFEHLDNILPSLFGGVWSIGEENFHRIRSQDFTVVAFLDETDRRSTHIQRILVKDHLKQLIDSNNTDNAIEKLLGYHKFISHSSMLLIKALNEGDIKTVGELVSAERGNLLFDARQKSIPRLGLIKQTIMENGAYGCAISGSGPAIFAITDGKDAAKSLRDNIVKKFSERKLKWLISSLNESGSEAIQNIDNWFQQNCENHNFW